MPPPPSPLSHRRSRIPTDVHYPPSPPYSPDTSPGAPRSTSLLKGATFHVPLSPPTEDSPVLSIPHLARRSPTGSQSSLISLLFGGGDGAARSIQDSIQDFERTFSGARGKQRAHRRGTDEFHDRCGPYSPCPLVSDEGLGTSVGTPTDKDLTIAFDRALDLDSGLGSSIHSEIVKITHDRMRGESSKEDVLTVEDLIQGVVEKAPRIRQRKLSSEIPSAIVRSISPMHSSSSRQSQLSNFARQKFDENILQPILRESRFKSFHPLVATLGSRTNKTIKCLRDLEQSLIFEPLRFAISHTHYRSFGEFSIQLVLDTFHHLSESEQRRASDRPYDNGYFLDLVQQVGRLAAQVGAARRARSGQINEGPDVDEMDYSPDDEVTLEGGLGQTGRPAELVRWKNGEGISLRTNERYEAQPVIKRQRSNASLDDDAERSMARRKKNAEPRAVELKCSDRSCEKIFNRKCDLAKHEKTHSRPFKCPELTCKYHEQGLPTEKERDRHINDKHSANPRYFHCQYCPFKTKRDSNCKQHMEKKHGWAYERVKGNAKSMKTPHQTPQTPSLSTPSVSDDLGSNSVYGSDGGSNFTPYTISMDDFGDPVRSGANPYQVSLFPNAPSQSGSYSFGSPDINFNSPPYGTRSSAPDTRGMDFTSPSAQSQSYLDPATLSYTHGHAFNVPPFDPLHIDIDYNGEFSERMLDYGSHSLQPRSDNPSISGTPPMATEDNLFHSAHQMLRPAEHAMLNSYTNMAGLPSDDFALFGASGDAGMTLSNADIPSRGSGELFSSVDLDYSDSQLGRYVNF